jgi:hypothetical protein
MACKRKRKKPVDATRQPRPEWTRFCAAYHGRGPHRGARQYRRRGKHEQQYSEES